MANTPIETPGEWINDWRFNAAYGIDCMLKSYAGSIDPKHLKKTPERFVKAMQEMLGGTNIKDNHALSTLFPNKSRGMIVRKEISFYSVCAHHLLPFFGMASFGYIPANYIVGISKVDRLIDAHARRLQVQEDLTSEIVDAFMRIVQPVGCGLVMRAYHMCCMTRGVKQPTAFLETTEVRGSFLGNEPTKAEFIQSVAAHPNVWK